MLLLLMLLPLVIALWACLAKKASFYTSVLSCCCAIALGIGIYLLALFAMTGMDILTYLSQQIRDYLAQEPELTNLMYAMLHNGQTTTTDMAVHSVGTFFDENYIYNIPAYMTQFCMYGGLVIYLIAHGIAKRTGKKTAFVPRFGDFHLPRYLGKWACIAFILVFILSMTPLASYGNMGMALSVIYQVFGCMFAVLGMAFLEWFMRRGISSPVPRVIIIALIFVLIPAMLMFIGVFEQIFQIRRRAQDEVDQNR